MANKIWKFFILISIFCFGISSGALDASAVLLDCEKDSSKDDIKRSIPPYHTIDNCTRKIRITLNISNSGKTPVDLDYSFLNQLSDPDTGVSMYLLNPVILRLRQDQVLLAYPFNYLSAVNAKASEIVINYENRKNFTGCDDTSQINPTCGLKHMRGKSLPYSQGFCCFCPEAPVKQKQTRGGQACSLDNGDPSDFEKQKYKASAHCLQLSDIWYSVSAISEPTIIHENFMQVYNQKHLKNGSSVWVALTHNEDFEMGYKNPYQYDENKTILISYMTSSPNNKSVTLPIKDRRLLTPQPMPAVELSKLPIPVKNGATDYLLIPNNMINPDGDDCDVAGVSYEAFAKQTDKCDVVKDTCLKNQPLYFWEMDDEKRKAGAKGTYLLENYAIPYKDPIIVHPETKDHWLATEYLETHLTILTVEINADEIAIMNVGKYAQISKIMSSTTTSVITIYLSILNAGLMPAKFKVQAVKCAFGVGDSNIESIVIPPQMTQDVMVSTKPGSVTLAEKFSCTVQVTSDFYGVVATRDVVINPLARCVCNFHCECACLSDSLKCELMSEEDYQAAGFRGSLPILTAKPPQRIWILKHPYLALLAFSLLLLLIGFIKGIFGLAGFIRFGDFGMEKFLYRPKKIKKYPQFDLKNTNVEYDGEGYPIHPDTKKRIKVIGEELLFALNCLFMFFWPCSKTKDFAVKKHAELKKRRAEKKKGTDDASKKQTGSPGKDSSKRSDAPGSKPGRSGKGQPGKAAKRASAEDRSAASAKDKSAPSARLTASAEDRSTAAGAGHLGDRQLRTSMSDSESELTTGPVADPLNKELERWQKGTDRIQAVI